MTEEIQETQDQAEGQENQANLETTGKDWQLFLSGALGSVIPGSLSLGVINELSGTFNVEREISFIAAVTFIGGVLGGYTGTQIANKRGSHRYVSKILLSAFVGFLLFIGTLILFGICMILG